MRFIKFIFIWVLLASAPLVARCAEHTPEAGMIPAPVHDVVQTGGHGEEGLTLLPVVLFKVGPLPLTNSMLVSWIVAVALILFAQIATRNVKDIPSGAQNFWEWLVESLYQFLEDIIG